MPFKMATSLERRQPPGRTALRYPDHDPPIAHPGPKLGKWRRGRTASHLPTGIERAAVAGTADQLLARIPAQLAALMSTEPRKGPDGSIDVQHDDRFVAEGRHQRRSHGDAFKVDDERRIRGRTVTSASATGQRSQSRHQSRRGTPEQYVDRRAAGDGLVAHGEPLPGLRCTNATVIRCG